MGRRLNRWRNLLWGTFLQTLGGRRSHWAGRIRPGVLGFFFFNGEMGLLDPNWKSRGSICSELEGGGGCGGFQSCCEPGANVFVNARACG